MVAVGMLFSLLSVSLAIYFGLRQRNIQKVLRIFYDVIFKQSQFILERLRKLGIDANNDTTTLDNLRARIEEIQESVKNFNETLFEAKETLYHGRSPEKIQKIYSGIQSKMEAQIEEEGRKKEELKLKRLILKAREKEEPHVQREIVILPKKKKKKKKRKWLKVLFWLFILYMVLMIISLFLSRGISLHPLGG